MFEALKTYKWKRITYNHFLEMIKKYIFLGGQ